MLSGAALAVLGVLTGLAYRIPAVHAAEAAWMMRVNRAGLTASVDGGLAVVRLLGTTPLFVIVLALVALWQPSWALGLGAAALGAEGASMGLKLVARRPRPFALDEHVVVRLPRRPTDPSFPSGDAMRAGFLTGVAWVALPFAWGAAGVVLGWIVAGGRVRAGAHYPLDVWAGWSLGLGASLAWAAWAIR